jgi:fluoride ion exporter CrcB/FEX
MLSYIWVSVRGVLSRFIRFWTSWMAALRCDQPFRGDTLAFNVIDSFIKDLLAALADSGGRRANVEGNG